MAKKRKNIVFLLEPDESLINHEKLNSEINSIPYETAESFKKDIQDINNFINSSNGYLFNILFHFYKVLISEIKLSGLSENEYFLHNKTSIDYYNFFRSSLGKFIKNVPPIADALTKYFDEVEEIRINQDEKGKYKAYKHLTIDNDGRERIYQYVANYFMYKYLIEAIPIELINYLKELFINILPQAESFNSDKLKNMKGITSNIVKEALKTNEALSEFNQNTKDFFGLDLASQIRSAKENYKEDELLNGDLLYREGYFRGIANELKFNGTKVPKTFKYVVMHDILSITHPHLFTTALEWDKGNHIGDSDSHYYRKKQEEEVDKFFNYKKLA